METLSTKDKIMDTAIEMFADKGYDTVSMRDIAAAVGIRVSSIYHHFSSKLEILESMYAFYARERRHVFPNTQNVLRALETEPLEQVLPMMSYYWPPQIQEKMDRIILIASRRILIDKDSENFVRENFFDALSEIWIQLLHRGIELGKIRPVDIGCYTKLLTCYAFNAAQLNCTAMKLSLQEWTGGLGMFYSLLKPTE